ncbi:MAG: tetratricopeptide repeat protein, partial [Planctomycetales bacterium]
QAKAWQLMAHVHRFAQEFTDSLDAYGRALELNPQDSQSFLGRSVVLAVLYDDLGALSDLNSLVKLNPNAQSYYQRGMSLYRLGHLEEAVADFEAAARKCRGWDLPYLALGMTRSSQKKYDEAIEQFTYVIRLFEGKVSWPDGWKPNPVCGACNRRIPVVWGVRGHESAYLQRGMAKYYQEDPEAALADVNRAIEIQPRFHRAVGNRGLIKSKLGDHEGAMKDHAWAAKHANPSRSAIHYSNLSRCKLRVGKLKEALADADMAVVKKPKSWIYYSLRARIHRQLQDKQAALSDYALAAKFHEQWAKASQAKRDGNPSKVAQDFNELLRTGPDNPFSHFAREVVVPAQDPDNDMIYFGSVRDQRHWLETAPLLIQEKYAAAKETLNLWIEELPQDDESWRLRGNVKKRLGDLSGARIDLDHAIKLDPKKPQNYNDRALLDWSLGDSAAALKYYDQSLLLDERQPWTRHVRARILYHQGKFLPALKEFQQLVRYGEETGGGSVSLRDFAAIRVWLSHIQRGESQLAVKAIQDRFGDRAARPDDWEACLARFCRNGNIQDLLDQCESDNEDIQKDRLADAYLLIALARLAQDDRNQAETFFRKVTEEIGISGGTAYAEAVGHLKTFAEADKR